MPRRAGSRAVRRCGSHSKRPTLPAHNSTPVQAQLERQLPRMQQPQQQERLEQEEEEEQQEELPLPSQQQQQQHPVAGGAPLAASSGGGSGSVALPHFPPPPAAYLQQMYAQQALTEQLQGFWAQMQQEVEEHSESLPDFKSQALPLARIKKVRRRRRRWD